MAIQTYDPGLRKFLMGLVADTPPTTNMPVGSEFIELDSGIKYIFDGTDWVAKEDTIAGAVSISGALPALATGTAYIGTSGLVAPQVHGTLNAVNPGVLAAAGNYDAGEVISQNAGAGAGLPWVFAGMGRVNGGGGRIEAALLECSEDSLLSRVRLWLFNAAPTTSEMDDNSAFNITAADRAKYVGKIDFPAFRDAGDISVAEWEGSQRFTCAAGTTSLWGIMQLLDAETLETAGMTLRATLDIAQY